VFGSYETANCAYVYFPSAPFQYAQVIRRRAEKQKPFGEMAAATELCLSMEILAKITNKDLGDQINKWREFDKSIGVKSKDISSRIMRQYLLS
jgi:hypothetical protein